MNRDIGKIRLDKQEEDKLLDEIAGFCSEELDLAAGIIRQKKILDFFMERVAPAVYNQALEDAKAWHQRMLEYMDEEYYALYKND